MINKLTLENFKAFGKRSEIEFAPITLIFGQNSAGKSSILQSLSMLKQTVASSDSAALLPRVENGYVDLGGFQDLVFDHDVQRTLHIGLSIESKKGGRIKKSFSGGNLEFQLRREKSGKVNLKGIKLLDQTGEQIIAAFQVRNATEEDIQQLDSGFRNSYVHQSKTITGTRVCVCRSITSDKEFWQPYFEHWKENRVDVLQELIQAYQLVYSDMDSDLFTSEGTINLIKELMKENQWKSIPKRGETSRTRYWFENEINQQDLEKAITFYSSEFSAEDFIDRIVSYLSGSIMRIEGLIPSLHPRQFSRHSKIPEYAINLRLPHRNKSRKMMLDWEESLNSAGANLLEFLSDLFPLGPIRQSPERWYIYTGSAPRNVGFRGDKLPDLLFQDPGLVDKANKWLSRLEIGYAISVDSIGGESSTDLYALRLTDLVRKGKVEVGLSDVGFGVSQILPFLVQTLASKERVITIEQPEVHVHPKLQADLGELLAEGIKKPYSHQFLVETHSEHLILRIQKLIRQGKLSPNDVSVLFVSREEGGSRVERLRLDEDGYFIDNWPGGFFSERLKELS